MPNWCFNTLIITGNEKDLLALKEKAQGDKEEEEYGVMRKTLLDFNKFLPYPAEFKERDDLCHKYREYKGEFCVDKRKFSIKEEKELLAEIIKRGEDYFQTDGYNLGGYDWCSANWGTKWNACQTSCHMIDRTLTYTFDTAWAPPLGVLTEMSKQFPDLKMKLMAETEGYGREGKYNITFKGGK